MDRFVRQALLIMLFAGSSFAQAFPRFSITAGQYGGRFTTDARVNPTIGPTEGTALNLERDLGLASSKRIQRFAIEWRPFVRHELAANYVAANRGGSATLDREIRFQNQIYPFSANVTSVFDTSKWEATYTYWASRSERRGFGITLGAAGLSIDATLVAKRPNDTLTLTQNASTKVPVALIGAQARYAFNDRVIARFSAATLPRVKIDVYSGRAVSGDVRLEVRVVRNIAVGAGYDYFDLDGTIDDPSFNGALSMKVRGPEAYVRIGF